MRIGGQLVAAGLVAAEHVEECLHAQVIEGARLGTNLVERSHIRLDPLTQALARQHGMAAATNEYFNDADAALQALLTPELAARWHAIPLSYISRDPAQVAVATTDPLPEEGLEALQKALHSTIIPAVAPELRILYYLEQIYNIPRINRFLRVPNLSDREPAPATPQEALMRERRQYVQPVSQGKIEPPSALARIAIRKMNVGSNESTSNNTSIKSIEDAMVAMRRSRDRNRLGKNIKAGLACLDKSVDVGMVLVFRKGMATGWTGFVRDGTDRLIEGIVLPLSEPSVFRTVLETGKPTTGAPQPTALDSALWEGLRCSAPQSWIVAPSTLREHTTVAALYVHSHKKTLGDNVIEPILKLSDTLSTCFRKLIAAANR